MDLNTRGLVNYLLLPVSGIFYFLSTLRKFLYQVGLLTVRHFDVPVIVVG
ncbi:MAG: tetraacyldisaccharide 4'-kinase, partial [Candidatus Thioglobus sp.]|nr:tetraacyldisaccharide 4'-kinase [Candidatus Thioglobus sp.]MBT5783787.1 tetraacyldisaccharide 4'-kinase [Candidatus Thioglobus sp.]